MGVLAPYVCTWCHGIRGYCPICGASIHDDEFVSGVGCVVCNVQLLRARIDAKASALLTEER